jgi:signal transduction histidine kinase
MTRKYGGTGLGLAISSRLVNMMGDRIRVTSDIAKAALFTHSAIPNAEDFIEKVAGDKERCLQAGMDGYVSKPLRVEDLFSTIEEVLLIPVRI